MPNPIYAQVRTVRVIQTRNIRDIEDPESKDNEFMLNYKHQLAKSPRQFKRKNGLFIDFIDRNQWQMKHNLVSKERLKTDFSINLKASSRTVEAISAKRSNSVVSVSHQQNSLDVIKKYHSSKFSISTRGMVQSRLETITKSATDLSRSPLLEKSRLRSQRKQFSEESLLLLDKRKLMPGMQITKTTFPLINKLKTQREGNPRKNLE